MPWLEFWPLVRQLSGDSRFAKAQLNDRAVVEQMLDDAEADEKENGTQEWRPPAEDWSLMHELVAQVRDRLGAVAKLIAELPTTVETRRPVPPPFPRPLTEYDQALAAREKVREDQYDQHLMDVVDQAKARWRAMQDEQAQEAEAMADALGD